MKPFIIQLPDIFRGCDYPAISFFWKDHLGQPFDLTGWLPVCSAVDFSFNAHVANESLGESRIVINQRFTANLKLGRQSWDFIWLHGPTVYPPVLAGVVTVREPLADTTSPGPPEQDISFHDDDI